jgi:two-component system OmpR family response regulator
VLLVSRDEVLASELCLRLRPVGLRPTIVAEVPVSGWTSEQPVIVVVDTRSVGPSLVVGVRRCLDAIESRVRFLYLTQSANAAERVALLRSVADDVMSFPVDHDELGLRITKLIERGATPAPRLVVGGLVLDEEHRQAVLDGRRLRLSPTEFAVLRLLIRHCGEAVSRRQILRDVWGYDDGGDAHVVELYISYLRKKLGPSADGLIRTVRGVGYMASPLPTSAVLEPKTRAVPVPAAG